MYKLVIQDGDGKTEIVRLAREEISIGRKEGNTIRLTERNVSRRHAVIRTQGEKVHIEDLGSYNGVSVNGNRIAQRTMLGISDRVKIGDYFFELKSDAPASRTQPITATLLGGMEDTTITNAPVMAADEPTVPNTVAETQPMAQRLSARLVALSSNFAGEEWLLNGEEHIVGRTNETDIAINHRSISRRHARLLHEAKSDRWIVMDLQSANGVRINGEPYGRAELRRGDVVDLGHVRLRYVEPGEDFVLGRDAQISDVPEPKSRLPMFLGLAMVGALIAGVAYWVVRPRDADVVSAPIAAISTGAGRVDASPVAKASDARGENPTLTPDAIVQKLDVLAEKLDECRAARDAQEWSDLASCAKEILRVSPKHKDASDMAALAVAEAANQKRMGAMEVALKGRYWAGAAKELARVDKDSVYAQKAQDAFDNGMKRFVEETRNRAIVLGRIGKCRELDKLVDSASAIYAGAADVARDVPCKAAANTDGGGATSGGGSGGGSGSQTATPAASCSIDDLLAETQSYGSASQWAAMLKTAEKAMACDPTNARARQFALMAACKGGNQAKANRYWSLYPGLRTDSMRNMCVGIVNE